MIFSVLGSIVFKFLIVYYSTKQLESKLKKNKKKGQIKADLTTSNFLKAVFHKFHLVYSWILCPI